MHFNAHREDIADYEFTLEVWYEGGFDTWFHVFNFYDT